MAQSLPLTADPDRSVDQLMRKGDHNTCRHRVDHVRQVSPGKGSTGYHCYAECPCSL